MDECIRSVVLVKHCLNPRSDLPDSVFVGPGAVPAHVGERRHDDRSVVDVEAHRHRHVAPLPVVQPDIISPLLRVEDRRRHAQPPLPVSPQLVLRVPADPHRLQDQPILVPVRVVADPLVGFVVHVVRDEPHLLSEPQRPLHLPHPFDVSPVPLHVDRRPLLHLERRVGEPPHQCRDVRAFLHGPQPVLLHRPRRHVQPGLAHQHTFELIALVDGDQTPPERDSAVRSGVVHLTQQVRGVRAADRRHRERSLRPLVRAGGCVGAPDTRLAGAVVGGDRLRSVFGRVVGAPLQHGGSEVPGELVLQRLRRAHVQAGRVELGAHHLGDQRLAGPGRCVQQHDVDAGPVVLEDLFDRFDLLRSELCHPRWKPTPRRVVTVRQAHSPPSCS